MQKAGNAELFTHYLTGISIENHANAISREEISRQINYIKLSGYPV